MAPRLVALLLAVSIAATTVGCQTSPEPVASPTASTATLAQPAADSAAGDVMFAQMMIPHHEQAVQMSELALDNPTASPQVQALATQIKAAQGPEIELMQGWLKTWGAPATAGPEHAGHSAGMMSEADLTTLRAATGAAFDTQWLTMMIDHHKGAVTMAQQVLATTNSQDVRTLAQAIVTSQQAEITTMQGMLGQ